MPRQIRLGIFLLVVVLLIAGIVLIVRGVRGRSSRQDALAPVATSTPAVEDGQADLNTQVENTPEPQPESTPVPVAEPKAGGRSVTIRAIGDIVADTEILTAAKSQELGYDFRPFFEYVKEAMGKADYTVLNVDGPLGGSGGRGYRGYPQFNTPPHLINALQEAGVDMLTLANNHALDTFYDGLISALDNLDSVEMDHIGAYRSQEEYDTPYVKDINGISIGFLNYTTGTNSLENHSDEAAQIYGLRYTRNSHVGEDIKALRNAGAEAVVVFMHWGNEYKRVPDAEVEKMAQKLANYGADVVIGGHPHTVQRCQYITGSLEDGTQRQTLVLYSMGNFFTDHRIQYTDAGIIFEFTLNADENSNITVTAPKYVPVYVWRWGSKGAYNYRVVPIGDMVDNRPPNMDDENYSRMSQSLNEIKEIIGDVAQIARN